MRKQADAPKRNRTEQIKFWATPEEKALILQKMALYGTGNMGAYLRKMAIDGYVIKLDLPELKEMIRLLGIANNNINQIARSLNSTGRIYEADIQEIRDRIDGLYDYAMQSGTQIAKRLVGAHPPIPQTQIILRLRTVPALKLSLRGNPESFLHSRTGRRFCRESPECPPRKSALWN